MISRALLAAAGVVLAGSLFLSWFSGGVSGWEHFAWADVALVVVAVVLIATAVRPVAALRVVVVLLCALGIAVVLGHGFVPDKPAGELLRLRAGGYVALAAVTMGIVGALAAWPRSGRAILLLAAAGGIVGALLSGWGFDDGLFFGTLDEPEGADVYENGFERWYVLDVALLALAAALLVAAFARLPGWVRAVLAVASVAAAICVVVGVREQFWFDEGFAWGPAQGYVVALLALVAAVAGLALRRPAPGPAERAG